MFPNRYFGRYFADRFWPPDGAAAVAAEPAHTFVFPGRSVSFVFPARDLTFEMPDR